MLSTKQVPIVFVFLRGGADGLALVQPLDDASLRAARPSLVGAAPDDRKVAAADRLVALDADMGLHPGLTPLEALYRRGDLAIVHGVGSDDDTRSHFEAQEQMEHGASRAAAQASGVFARHLGQRHRGRVPGLAAISVGERAAESLTGIAASAIRSLDDLQFDPRADADYEAALLALHRATGAAEQGIEAGLRASVEEAVEAARVLRRVATAPSSAPYPASPLGRALETSARLLRADVGVEVVTVDHDGWDSHFVQRELVDGLAGDLGRSLGAFALDLGDRLADVCVVVISEFGRRVHENVSLGTDHGRAGVAFVIGGGVRGGRVIGAPRSLSPDVLEGPGDLPVSVDYRDVLAEALARTGGDPASVFAGYRPGEVGLFATG